MKENEFYKQTKRDGSQNPNPKTVKKQGSIEWEGWDK